MKKRYKVIEEYPRYYVTVDDHNFRECFQKALYKPDKDGYIYKELPNYSGNSVPHPPSSIYKKFNPSVKFKNK